MTGYVGDGAQSAVKGAESGRDRRQLVLGIGGMWQRTQGQGASPLGGAALRGKAWRVLSRGRRAGSRQEQQLHRR